MIDLIRISFPSRICGSSTREAFNDCIQLTQNKAFMYNIVSVVLVNKKSLINDFVTILYFLPLVHWQVSLFNEFFNLPNLFETLLYVVLIDTMELTSYITITNSHHTLLSLPCCLSNLVRNHKHFIVFTSFNNSLFITIRGVDSNSR